VTIVGSPPVEIRAIHNSEICSGGDIEIGAEKLACAERVKEKGLPLMPPTLLVELNTRSCRRSRRMIKIARITPRAWHPRAAAAASMLAIPRFARMVLAYPAGVPAVGTFHQANNSAPAWVKLHMRPGFVKVDPAPINREFQPCTVFVRHSSQLEQKWPVDKFGVDSAVLNRFYCIRDL
jgi:hypothetical protein